jgi:hypothetical protein
MSTILAVWRCEVGGARIRQRTQPEAMIGTRRLCGALQLTAVRIVCSGFAGQSVDGPCDRLSRQSCRSALDLPTPNARTERANERWSCPAKRAISAHLELGVRTPRRTVLSILATTPTSVHVLSVDTPDRHGTHLALGGQWLDDLVCGQTVPPARPPRMSRRRDGSCGCLRTAHLVLQ